MKPVSPLPSRPKSSTGRLILVGIIGISAVAILLKTDFREEKGPAEATESKRALSRPSKSKEQGRSDKPEKHLQAADGSEEPENEFEFAPLPPFDQEELERIARSPHKDLGRMADLIHRAAAEKDTRFRYLLDQPELRDAEALDRAPAMDLALSAYDYSVNGSEEALDHILEIHARESPGSDSDSVVTLSYLDEWDRTIKAYHAHFAQGADGAGGDAKRGFWEERKRLFPHQYRKFLREGGAETSEPRGR